MPEPARPGRALRRTMIAGMCILAAWGCAALGMSSPPHYDPEATAAPFKETLGRATEGDAASQNLLGFMLFFGEGAPRDPDAAQHWFERAARAGDPSAQVNLAILYELGTVVSRDRQEALRLFRLARDNPRRPVSLNLVSLLQLVADVCAPPAEVGPEADTFATYCAGCHGANGLAPLAEAPHFALGERMGKSDGALMETIKTGHGVMPDWSDKLPDEYLLGALQHARRLQVEFRHATLHRLRPPPDRRFRFGPMDRAFSWETRDPADESLGPSFDEACAAR